MNTAYMGDELRALRDTFGLTGLGREFMAKHVEIFWESCSDPNCKDPTCNYDNEPAPSSVSTPAQDATALADRLELAYRVEIYDAEGKFCWALTPDEQDNVVAALRATSQTPDAVREENWECSCGGDPKCPNPCRSTPSASAGTQADAVIEALRNVRAFINTALVDDINPTISKKMLLKHIDAALSQPQQADGRATPSPRDAHKQIPVQVWADIDVGISNAVRYLNTIPGVRTHASCQGTIGEGGPAPYRAQVMATWQPECLELLQQHFDITPLGENWGYLHPRGELPSIQHADQYPINEDGDFLPPASHLLPSFVQQAHGRGAVVEAIRNFCKSFGKNVCVVSSDGIERIYYAGLPVENLANCIVAALQQSPATDGPAK